MWKQKMGIALSLMLLVWTLGCKCEQRPQGMPEENKDKGKNKVERVNDEVPQAKDEEKVSPLPAKSFYQDHNFSPPASPLPANPLPTSPLLSNPLPASSPKSNKNNQTPTKINWYTSFEEGIMAAKNQNKPMMIDFYTSWCGWCEKLDQTTYVDPQVVELAQNFISVKVDCEKEPEVPAEFGVRGFPTILFVDAAGKLSNAVIGYREPQAFASEMEKAINR